MKRSAASLVVVALASLFAAPAWAVEWDDICETTVTEDIVLTEDLDSCDFTVASGVTVDLAGFDVGGTVVLRDADDVTISGGSVARLDVWSSSVSLVDVRLEQITQRDARIDALRVDTGFYFQTGDRTSEVDFRDGRISSFEHCIDCGTFRISGTSVETEIDGDGRFELVDNELQGLTFRRDAVVEMTGNVGTGNVELYRPSSVTMRRNMLQRANVIEATAATFELNLIGGLELSVADAEGASGLVDRNVLANSLGAGLRVSGPGAGRVEVRGNIARLNDGVGIDAEGVVDGGNNVAALNGELLPPGTPQCVGVTCATK